MITDKQFTLLVEKARSVSDVLRAMQRARVGTNYKMVRDRIEVLGLAIAHWEGKPSSERVPLELQLCERSSACRAVLKRRLIRESLLIEVCAICHRLPEWEGKPLVLRLDHINGVNDDNRLENLRLLCPNCDSQTSTYCGRNKKASSQQKCACGKTIAKRSNRCRRCQDKAPRCSKIEWPPTEELLQMAEELGYVGCGKRLGVSDNAVRRRLLKHAPIA